jgi:hypothetical protein
MSEDKGKELDDFLKNLGEESTMPNDVSSRFDASLNQLTNRARSGEFTARSLNQSTKSHKWLAAASIVAVFIIAGSYFIPQNSKVISKVAPTQTTTIKPTPASGISGTKNSANTPTKAASGSPIIPGGSSARDANVYGLLPGVTSNSENIIAEKYSGSNYDNLIGPLSEKLLPLSEPGSISQLKSDSQFCIRKMKLTNRIVLVDHGIYQGQSVLALWIAKSPTENVVGIFGPGCSLIKVVKE